MDLIEALLTDIYNRITGDAEMQTLMGGSIEERGEWLHPEEAEKDAEFPYLVHSFEEETVGTDFGFADGFYTIDAWTYNSKWTQARNLRKRLIELLDECYLTSSVYTFCYLWLEGRSRAMPTDNVMVKRLSLPFRARHARTQEIKSILAR